MTKGADKWTAWNEERARFKENPTQSFKQDVEALEEHIRKLKGVAPKLSSTSLDPLARKHIDKLEQELEAAKHWAAEEVKKQR